MLEESNEQHQKFLTPLKVRSKGRSPSKRKKSKVEEIIVRNKKKVFINNMKFIIYMIMILCDIHVVNYRKPKLREMKQVKKTHHPKIAHKRVW